MQVHPVERDKLFYGGLNCNGRSGPALVMAGITVPVSNSNSNTGFRSGRPAPERKSIFAGVVIFPVQGSGPAGPESPAKARITGTEELVRVCWHALLE
jgi:hypothetical protein